MRAKRALPTAAGVLLSLSRASWLGLAAGLFLIGALRYRRILVVGALLGGLDSGFGWFMEHTILRT